MKVSAFTSASGGFPYKIFKNVGLVSSIANRIIQPIHIQLNPTNRCNMSCTFCSCSKRERDQELSLDSIKEIFYKFSLLGCKAVTITGGGEPLMHPNIKEIIESALAHKIAVGLVTNGKLISKVSPKIFDMCTWVRISVSNESEFDKFVVDFTRSELEKVETGWSFSYVVTRDPDYPRITKMIRFANRSKFTHVRVVNDILDPSCDLSKIRANTLESGISDHLVIWQDRQHYSVGAKRCLISLLKPVIGANGCIYPCCGAQYAEPVPARDYPSSMVMGSIEGFKPTIEDIWEKQMAFDGSRCIKCYYEHYNSALSSLLAKLEHSEFV